MSTTTIELPLFPLTVLFPGTVLPLHIFEPRYRQMIVDCQRKGKPFGIVLAKPESKYLQEVPYSIGTIAEIRNLERLEDGRYTLMALGVRRFRILSQHHEKPYLSALVELYEDTYEPEQELAVFRDQAHTLFQDYLKLLLQAVNEQAIEVQLPNSPEDLSYLIASFLDIQDEQKQHFLELTSTQQRLCEEIAILRPEIPVLRQILSKTVSEERSRLN